MNKSIFGDQSSYSRLLSLKSRAGNTVSNSYNGYYVKDTKERNSVIQALTRTRGGGSRAPLKSAFRTSK
jgi:hypothetical protein